MLHVGTSCMFYCGFLDNNNVCQCYFIILCIKQYLLFSSVYIYHAAMLSER